MVDRWWKELGTGWNPSLPGGSEDEDDDENAPTTRCGVQDDDDFLV